MNVTFTAEEITFLNHYKADTKDNIITKIKKTIQYIDDKDMQGLAENVLIKLETISDLNFQSLDFSEAIEINDSEYSQ